MVVRSGILAHCNVAMADGHRVNVFEIGAPVQAVQKVEVLDDDARRIRDLQHYDESPECAHVSIHEVVCYRTERT